MARKKSARKGRAKRAAPAWTSGEVRKITYPKLVPGLNNDSGLAALSVGSARHPDDTADGVAPLDHWVHAEAVCGEKTAVCQIRDLPGLIEWLQRVYDSAEDFVPSIV